MATSIRASKKALRQAVTSTVDRLSVAEVASQCWYFSMSHCWFSARLSKFSCLKVMRIKRLGLKFEKNGISGAVCAANDEL